MTTTTIKGKSGVSLPAIRFVEYIDKPKSLDGRVDLVEMVVPDPFDGKPTRLKGNGRVFEYWLGKGQIDAAEYTAAKELDRLFYILRAGGIGSSELQTFVDKSFNANSIGNWSEQKCAALIKLGKVEEKLGHTLVNRLEDLCHGLKLKEAAKKYGYYSAEEVKGYGMMLRDYLRQLVNHWGLETGRKN